MSLVGRQFCCEKKGMTVCDDCPKYGTIAFDPVATPDPEPPRPRIVLVTPVEYGVIRKGALGRLSFYVGVQSFSLDVEFEDEDGCTAEQHRDWFAKQLGTALDRLANPFAKRVDKETL